MNQRVLIAYDGSPCADAALRDLSCAGLPPDAEALVLTIADVWPPDQSDESADWGYANLDPRIRTRVLELREKARSKLADAAIKAEDAARRIQSAFPGWKVRSENLADSPAWGILNRASLWPADLIVVGSHGMSATDRLFIGSVSQRVMTHATCSVRVARESSHAHGSSLRLIIGFDGSRDAEAAVRQVASCSWPAHTEVRLITGVDDRMVTAFAAIADEAAGQLRAAGLVTTCFLMEGEPKRLLLETAKNWQADCIFLGATGVHGLKRLVMGSVSSAVTAHAPCTVEVVRPAKV